MRSPGVKYRSQTERRPVFGADFGYSFNGKKFGDTR